MTLSPLPASPPGVADDLRRTVLAQGQGAMSLFLAFVGISGGLFERLAEAGASPAALAATATLDEGYVQRWCEAAFAFGYLEEADGAYSLGELGRAFLPSTPGTLMPFAVQAVLGAHMMERAAGLMHTGQRPGESVLAEWATILPWFGPMLEASFGALFEREILPTVPVFAELDAQGGVAVDLGCGNGWYLRKLAARFANVRGIGLDGFEENVRQADAAARAAGVGERLSFRAGDIHHYTVTEKVALIAMNRALHHVWDRKESVFAFLRDSLAPGGAAVIWEPRWPDAVASLRDPRRRPMAFQNLGEHVQGNHFLRPAEIEAELRAVGLSPETFLFAEGNEAVVVGRKARLPTTTGAPGAPRRGPRAASRSRPSRPASRASR